MDQYEALCEAAGRASGVVRLGRLEDLFALTVTFVIGGKTAGIGVVTDIDALDEAAETAFAWMIGRGYVNEPASTSRGEADELR